MKQFIVNYPKTSTKMHYVIRHFLGGGGYLVKETPRGEDDSVDFVIHCNNDTEFADLFVEIGSRAKEVTPREVRLHTLQLLREQNYGDYSREIRNTCEEVSYPGGTTAFYDDITDTYYNGSGQQLKRPEDYHPDNDGRYY